MLSRQKLGGSYLLLAIFYLVTFSQNTLAHVKWFSEYSVTAAPKSIDSILNTHFITIALLSICFVFIISLIEKSSLGLAINERIVSIRSHILAHTPEDIAPRLIRYTLLIFFTCLWATGGVILTPELTHQSSLLVEFIQLSIIIGLLTPKTSKYAGLGIISLWIYSATHYGFFHLSDYAFFLGIGVFLILSSLQHARITSGGFWIIYISIVIALQWGSIEKFAYPQWFYPILAEKPYLTMGIDKDLFIIMAGFVEFSFAFLMLTTTGIGFILATLGLTGVFLLAIIEFGKIDAIGHSAIIIILIVMALRGPCRINRYLSTLSQNTVVHAVYLTLLFVLALATLFSLYYGIRMLWMNAAAITMLTLGFSGITSMIILLLYRAKIATKLKDLIERA